MSGRLSDLLSFDVLSNTWARLAPGPDPGRGGTVLAPTKLGSQDVFLRFAGISRFLLIVIVRLTPLCFLRVRGL